MSNEDKSMMIILNTYITSKWFNIDNKIVNHHP
ncbi:tryptophanase leader peptide [Enterobacteriaceae bacterium RIT814]|uniref:Tryptophanase leader peptide n=2 Tax=Leclercia TaxID=83654 RepID=A0A2C5TEJ9_9ENTR|nr:tryptophanase leader peptide [Leclercia adecarboxylata]MBM6607881.1 tryptophanase leader peptide [Enterobacteriaceae bacterium RIT 814]MBS0853314.1 tryptophanase leader peptide [Enterobacter sp. JGM127]MCE6965450.1 tryptophanase leader peptide [Enterobacter sp. MW07]MCG1032869.1 tryptophanase leader peptide [Bacillus amyloliquefaciens]QSW35515.1 tryptophanase leader peptide [Leclercia pneumoniae]QVV62152.1 tryptophanase leader peptide [Leclercia sp. Colony189]